MLLIAELTLSEARFLAALTLTSQLNGQTSLEFCEARLKDEAHETAHASSHGDFLDNLAN